MKLLLDICCWLWWLSDIDKLSKQQLEAIANRQNQLFLVVTSDLVFQKYNISVLF